MNLTQRLVLDACTLHFKKNYVPAIPSQLAERLMMTDAELAEHLQVLASEGFLLLGSTQPTGEYETLATQVRRMIDADETEADD